MVKVYLPMGYPVQQGAEFETVVYQSNLVRSYTLPKDPRSDSQMFQRRFLSDVSKMRGTLGKWGKAAMVDTLGRTWPSVLFQLIKSDSFSWWSDATEEWESFDEVEQQAWRDVSPYQVTFNDMGWIFFSLARVVYRAIRHFSVAWWKTVEWGEGDSEAALDWWVSNHENALLAGAANYDSPLLVYRGAWVLEGYYLNPNQLQMQSSGSADDAVECYCYSKDIYTTVRKDPECGIAEVFIEGVKWAEYDLSPGNFGAYTLNFLSTKKRLRSVLLRGKDGGKVTFAGYGV